MVAATATPTPRSLYVGGISETSVFRVSATAIGEKHYVGFSGGSALAFGPQEGALLLRRVPDALRSIPLAASGKPEGEGEVVTWAPRNQSAPAVAATSAGYFVAWEESIGNGPREIRGTIVAPDGDRSGDFAIEAAEAHPMRPSVASNGPTVLVAWIEPPEGLPPAIVRGRRFTATGAPLDAEPFDITLPDPAGESGASPDRIAAAWNGRYFLVVWTSLDRTLRLTRVTAEGIVLDPEGIELGTSERKAPQQFPAIAAATGRSLVVWQDGEVFPCWQVCLPMILPRIEGIRLDEEGLPLDPAPVVITPAYDSSHLYRHFGQNPHVATDGTDFLVTWWYESIRAARVSRDGAVSAPHVIDEMNGSHPFVGRTREGWIASWREIVGQGDYETHARTLGADGSPAGDALRIGENVFGPLGGPYFRDITGAVASRDGAVMVIWIESPPELGGARRLEARIHHPPPSRRKPVRRPTAGAFALRLAID